MSFVPKPESIVVILDNYSFKKTLLLVTCIYICFCNFPLASSLMKTQLDRIDNNSFSLDITSLEIGEDSPWLTWNIKTSKLDHQQRSLSPKKVKKSATEIENYPVRKESTFVFSILKTALVSQGSKFQSRLFLSVTPSSVAVALLKRSIMIEITF